MKSVIRAGCDVDHFHKGHTPLMIASIRGHDDVVKELILAGCRLDLRSSKYFLGWLIFITMVALTWPFLVVWAVATLLMIVVPNMWVNMLGYWCLGHAISLLFFNEDSFKESGMLEMKSWTKYVAWTGAAVVCGALIQITPVPMLVAVAVPVLVKGTVRMIMAGTVVWVTTQIKVSSPAVAVAEAVTRPGILMLTVVDVWTGVAVVTVIVVVTLRGADTVAAVVTVTVISIWFWQGAQGQALATYMSIRPSTIGELMAVTGTLALTLTLSLALNMTVAGPDVMPSVLIIMMLADVMANMGVVLVDAHFQSFAGKLIPTLPAAVLLALIPIGVIRRMSTLSISGMTALHYAAWYDHVTCGTHLVEAGANVRAENKYFRTPLHICSHRFRAAVEQAQSSPPKQVIAVIGNTEYGKSTLIAALQSESRTLFQRLVYKLAQVHNIKQRTAGIETVPFSSAAYGETLFYDFAGQSAYHGPHQPFLEAILSKPDVSVIVLLLVKVTEERAFITQQLIRWLQPLALASTPSTPHVIVVGSFLDQAKSKKEAHQKLQGCIDSVQKEYPSLKLQEYCLLDCREPESADIEGLCSSLQQTPPIQSTSSALYNIRWVMAQLQKSFSEQSLQLSTFRVWLQDNAQILPTGLPPPENVCTDLSAAGYILFLRNKQDLSQSWLVLDLQTILHNVYGTLFSPSQDVVNQFGLLPCSHLSKLFPKLDPKMIQEVLITLEFCIKVDPLLLKKKCFLLLEQDEIEGWLYFPALASAKAHEVFTPDPQCLQWACWQLKTHDKHIILAHLLQGTLLHLAATHVFIEDELQPSERMHCCRVWVNGLSWRSTTGVDVAVHISNSSKVQVIGRSKEGPGELYRYMSSVTQSIFKTIAKLSPALKATPYIIHPYTYIGLDESTSSPPTTRYPVASIIRSIEASHKYVHS